MFAGKEDIIKIQKKNRMASSVNLKTMKPAGVLSAVHNG